VTAFVKVEREDVWVMFIRVSEDTPAAIQSAWAEFEEAAGLKGRLPPSWLHTRYRASTSVDKPKQESWQ
jgi:hypothetical protein